MVSPSTGLLGAKRIQQSIHSPTQSLGASSLTAPTTRAVTATNDAVNLFTSADVLKQLRSDDNETIYLASQ